MSALAASSFELYFYLGYRLYAEARTFQYRKRRSSFIRGIEQDFRSYTSQAGAKEASEKTRERAAAPRKLGAPTVS
jgi:hypothetical protein